MKLYKAVSIVSFCYKQLQVWYKKFPKRKRVLAIGILKFNMYNYRCFYIHKTHHSIGLVMCCTNL